MEGSPHLIDCFPQGQIIREDDHIHRMSAYFQIHSKSFEFNSYDHGSKQLKEKYKINKKIFRYFNKRHFLFSKFEEGIEIDEESWYSVIPEQVALHLKERLKHKKITKIFEPFSGIGGIAIHLCDSFQEYIVNDIDQAKLRMLKHNMKVYKKSINKLKYINQDFLEVEPFTTDAIIICPPWGGIDTNSYATCNLDEIMNPKLSEILEHAQKFSSQIILQMPKQTNLSNLISVVHQVGLKGIFSIQKIQTNQRCSQIFIYFGSDSFISISSPKLFATLTQDSQQQSKIDKKRIKLLLKQKSNEIMSEVYKTRYPNKRTFLV